MQVKDLNTNAMQAQNERIRELEEQLQKEMVLRVKTELEYAELLDKYNKEVKSKKEKKPMYVLPLPPLFYFYFLFCFLRIL